MSMRVVNNIKTVFNKKVLEVEFSRPFCIYRIQSLSNKKSAAKTTLAIPLVVIKAKFTLLKSFGFTSRCW